MSKPTVLHIGGPVHGTLREYECLSHVIHVPVMQNPLTPANLEKKELGYTSELYTRQFTWYDPSGFTQVYIWSKEIGMWHSVEATGEVLKYLNKSYVLMDFKSIESRASILLFKGQALYPPINFWETKATVEYNKGYSYSKSALLKELMDPPNPPTYVGGVHPASQGPAPNVWNEYKEPPNPKIKANLWKTAGLEVDWHGHYCWECTEMLWGYAHAPFNFGAEYAKKHPSFLRWGWVCDLCGEGWFDNEGVRLAGVAE